MKFTIKDLKKLLQSVYLNNVDEINIRSRHLELVINKNKTTDISKITNIQKLENHTSNIPIIKENITLDNASKTRNDNYSTIVSPMVGTFYKSPAPNEPPFVKVYDMVQKKQIVCIIEAMKLMNEIEAEVDGEIVEILVQDGDIIDCGQALMKIKPMDS